MTSQDPFASVAALGITAPRPAPPRPVVRSGPMALPQAIKQWRDASTGWLRVDDPEAAGLLAARQPATSAPRIVVLGETNRGKSSLINSLLGTPGLSPVDAGVATCSYLVFVHSDSPYAVARFGRGMADITFPPSDLRAWATVDGDPDVDIPPPRWIEVGVPADLARALTIVDTPGVGGLIAAHGELAAEAAAAASALLFVVDASAPFTRGELDFLAVVADRVDVVHFAVTKTDAYRGWREIVDADRGLLARYAPRFIDAPFHPLSSRLYEAAAGQTDPAIAKVLAEQSGVPQLRSVMATDVGAAAVMLSEANTIRASITVITGAISQLETSRRALTAGAAQSEVLKARREELLGQRKTGGRSWQVMLRAEIQRARVDLTHETAREVREASQMFRGAIDHADNAELKKMPFHIDAYARAMTQRAHARLIEAMGRICRSVLSELFTQDELTVLVSHLATRPYEGLTTRTLDKTRNMDETIMTLSGAGMGFTLSRMVVGLPFAALPAAFGVVLAPISIVVGGAAAFYLMRSRKRMADKQHLKQWLMEVLGEAKAQIDQNIAEQFVDADEQLTLALDDALTRQLNTLDNEIKEVDGALKLDATERATRLRSIDERKSAAAALMRSGEELLQRIRGTRVAALPPVGIDAAAAALGPALAGRPGGVSGFPMPALGAPPAATPLEATASAGPGARSIMLPAGLPEIVANQAPRTEPIAPQQVSPVIGAPPPLDDPSPTPPMGIPIPFFGRPLAGAPGGGQQSPEPAVPPPAASPASTLSPAPVPPPASPAPTPRKIALVGLGALLPARAPEPEAPRVPFRPRLPTAPTTAVPTVSASPATPASEGAPAPEQLRTSDPVPVSEPAPGTSPGDPP